MAASLNSVATCCYFTSECSRNSALKIRAFTSPMRLVGLRGPSFNKTKRRLCLLVTKDDRVVTDTGSKEAVPLVNEKKVVDSETTNNIAKEEKTAPKRLPFTAREKLKAARVLNRYNEAKESKPKPLGALGSKVLEALRESDKGKKKSGLPEAPTNMLDDGKRGMPKAGLTFELPVGMDVAVIIFSFVFISTVMFATTYLVWKLGAIHFNEY